jgi:hypothetical protein
MILDHFTRLARLYPTLVVPPGEHEVEVEVACPELLPHAEKAEFVSCVWLTTDGTSSLVSHPGPRSLRIAVRVPGTDRKLVSFRKWLRRERIDPGALVGERRAGEAC